MSTKKYININRLSDFGEGAIVPLRKSIAPQETSPATAAHAVDSYIMYGGEFYKVTSAISVGNNLVPGTNITKTNVMEEMNSGTNTDPYIYLTNDEYKQITPETDALYWVTDSNGDHGVYKNGLLVEGKKVISSIYGVYCSIPNTSSGCPRRDDSANFSDPVPALNGIGGSSPFDNLYPWNQMEEVTIDGNVLIKIPKFWYQIEYLNKSFNLKISDTEKDGFYTSPAHADRGDGVGERDYVYIGKYKCTSTDWKSFSGAKPKTNITRAEARTGITGLGTGFYMQDYAMYWTIRMLYLVEFANWDSQAKIGRGGGNGTLENTGAADGMAYHTGTMQSARNTNGVGVKYRGIEDLWANCYELIDGTYFNNKKFYIINTPSQFNDNKQNGVAAASVRSSNGEISDYSSFTNTKWALFPSYDKYLSTDNPDYLYTLYDVIASGGKYNDDATYNGLFTLYSTTYNNKLSTVGVRLQYLPT